MMKVSSLVFSIVVPVYNVELYLRECIESIIKQTYSKWELVLIDDGSTDRSGEICKRYEKQDDRIKVYTKNNSGQADSRNIGVEKAGGDYLLFVDSDDFIDGDTLQRCYEKCVEWNMPDVILSEGMFEVRDGVMAEDHQWESAEYQGFSGRETLLKTMKTAPNWSPCGKCYRVDFWKKHEFLFPTKRLAEDFALIDKVVLEADCVVMVPTFYYYRRFRENSTMTSVNKKLKFDELLNLIDWEQYLQDRKLDDELAAAFRKRFAVLYCHDILGNLYLFERKERKVVLTMAGKLKSYLSYVEGKEEKLVGIMVKTIGLKSTCLLLGWLKRYRIKKERAKYLR